MWDWDRRYDDAGDIDILGKSRELHVENSMEIIDPENQWGDGFLEGVRKAGKTTKIKGAEVTSFAPNEFYQLHVIEGDIDEAIECGLDDAFAFIETLEGNFSVSGQSLGQGLPAFVPQKHRE